MKKTILLAAALTAALLAGCTTDETNDTTIPAGKYTLSASLQSTRTGLTDETAAGAKVVWSKDDAIFTSDVEHTGSYTLASGENTTTATFSGNVELHETIYAYYPYGDDVTLTNGTITATLPAALSYAEASFATNTAPMAAIGTAGENLVFENLCAVLKLQYTGAEKISKIVIRSESVTDAQGTRDALPLSGDATVTFTGNTPSLAITGSEGYALTLSAGAEGEILDPNTAKGFYFVVPAGTYPRLVVELYDPENGLTTTKKLSGKTLKPGTILEINAFGYDSSVWDGVSVQEVIPAGDIYTIHTAAGLAWLSTAVNSGNTFSGKTIQLTADIDLNGKEWTPIGKNTLFRGTFDGGNHTISNLKVSGSGATDDNTKGLFGGAGGATFRNLTIDNANVAGSEYVGALVGTNYEGVFENCRVTNSKISGSTSTGALIGRIAEAKSHLQITGCSVKDCDVTILNNTAFGSDDDVAGKKIGGIVGAVAAYTDPGITTAPILTFANCTVDGLKINSLSGASTAVNDLMGQLDNLTALMSQVEFSNISVINGSGYRSADPYMQYIGALRLSVLTNPVLITLNGTAILCGATSSACHPGTYVIQDNVETISVSASDVTLTVPAGIEYPALTIAKDTKNLTIEGNYTPASTQGKRVSAVEGVTYMTHILKGADGVDNLTVRNVAFDIPAANYLSNHYAVIDFYYLSNVSNITIENCYSRNTLKPFVQIGVDQGPNTGTAARNITIRNNVVEFSPAAASNMNGIFLTAPSGTCTIEGNTISGAKYHGIFLGTPTADTYIRNNTIQSPGQDGIKIDTPSGILSITGNTIAASCNGIRVNRINVTTPEITVSGNKICSLVAANGFESDGTTPAAAINLISKLADKILLDHPIVLSDNDTAAQGTDTFAFVNPYIVDNIGSQVTVDGTPVN